MDIPYGKQLTVSELIKKFTTQDTDRDALRGYLHALADDRAEGLEFLCELGCTYGYWNAKAREILNMKVLPRVTKWIDSRFKSWEFLEKRHGHAMSTVNLLVKYCEQLQVLSGTEEKNVHKFLSVRLAWTCGGENKYMEAVHDLIKAEERVAEFLSLIPALINTWHLTPIMRLGLFRTIPQLYDQIKNKKNKRPLVWDNWNTLPVSQLWLPTTNEKEVLDSVRTDPRYATDVETIRLACGRELAREHTHGPATAISVLLNQLSFYIKRHHR